MMYLRNAYVLIFILLIFLIIRFIFRKYELHFKVLKELHSKKFKKINSFYNPLLGFYLFTLNVDEYLWFSSPVFYEKKLLNKKFTDSLKDNIKSLKNNNKKLYFSLIFFIIWIGVGFLLFFYH